MATDDLNELPTTEAHSERKGLRTTLAGALIEAARRLSPQQVARSYPLPERVTGAQAQQARLQQQLTARQQAAWQQSVGRARNKGKSQRPGQQQQSAAQQAMSPLAQTADTLNAGALDSVMQTNQAPQDTAATMYAPGSPLPVSPGLVPPSGPRQFEYPVSYNVVPQPRTTELSSAAQLRALAFAYEGIRLCEQVYYDVLAGLELKVGFKPNIIPDGESESDPKWRAIAAPAETFLAKPDGITPLNAWLTAGVRDLLELGGAYLYRQRDRAGRLLSLDYIDGATVKPLIDERGRMPRPPYPAYEQYLYGVSAYFLRADEVDWIRETTRTDSSYPTSRVEYIITRINQALRKQMLDLARYTDGAIPEGIFSPSEELALQPAQIEEAERIWNGLLAGNDAMRVRVKFAPWPGTFKETRDTSPQMDFDRYLLNITVGAFGLTMDELGMTDTSNKSVGASQQSVVYRRTVKPIAARFSAVLTDIVQAEFDPRLVVGWAGYEEEEDQFQKAQTLNIGVANGSLSPSRMARLMGWPVDLEVPPMVLTKDGPIWLEDSMNLRQAQMDARLKGLEFAMGAPGAAQDPATPPAAGASGNTAPATPAAPAGSGGSSAAASDDDDDADEPAAAAKPTPKAPVKPAQRAIAASSASADDIRAEWRAWYTRATRAAKAGQVGAALPSFERRAIPPDEYALCAADLAVTQSLDEVKAAFQRARARESQPSKLPALASVATLTSEQAERLTRRQAQERAGVAHARDELALRARDLFEQVAREGYYAAQGHAHGG